MSELGKLEKPSTDSFTGKKKLYCVPNVILFRDVPEEYAKLSNRYWADILLQLDKLEAAWRIKKVFCENIFIGGEEALNVLEKTNEKAFELIRQKVETGALLIPIESKDILGPFIDWRNCLTVVRTQEVFSKVYDFYIDALNKRLQHVQNTIEINLQEGEASLLVMEDEVRAKIQFTPDIEVFLVRPPSYDDLIRWLRDNLDKHVS